MGTLEKRRPSAAWLAIKEELAANQAGLKCNICGVVSVKTKKVVSCKSCKASWCGTCLVLPESKICQLCTSFIAKTQTVWVEGVVPIECLGKVFSTSFFRVVGDYAVVYPSKPEPATPVGTFDLCTAVTLSTSKYVYVTEATAEKELSVGEACKEPGSMFYFTLLEGQRKVTYHFIAETAKEAQMWIPAITRVVVNFHAQFKKGAVKKKDASEDDQVMCGNLRLLTGFPKSWKLMPFGLYKGGRFSFFKEDAYTPLKCVNMFNLKSATFHKCTSSGAEGQLLLLSGETPTRSVCLKPLPEDVDVWARSIPPVIEQIDEAEKQRKEQMNDFKMSNDDLMALAPKDVEEPVVAQENLAHDNVIVRPAAQSIAPTFGSGKWDAVRQKLIVAAQERKRAESKARGSMTLRSSEQDPLKQLSRAELQQHFKQLEERHGVLQAELNNLKAQAAVAEALHKELADLKAAATALSTKPLLLSAPPPSAPLSPPSLAPLSPPLAPLSPSLLPSAPLVDPARPSSDASLPSAPALPPPPSSMPAPPPSTPAPPPSTPAPPPSVPMPPPSAPIPAPSPSVLLPPPSGPIPAPPASVLMPPPSGPMPSPPPSVAPLLVSSLSPSSASSVSSPLPLVAPPVSPSLDDEEARLLEEIAKMERIAKLKQKLAALHDQIGD